MPKITTLIKEHNDHHFQLQACMIKYNSNSYMFPYINNSMKHQTNTCSSHDNMIHDQIQHKNPKVNMIMVGFYLT